MESKMPNKPYKIKNISDEMKIICYYRYFSLSLISLFFVAGNLHITMENKIVIILSLGIASYILNNLYSSLDKGNLVYIKLLISIEVIGNTLILIPSGGIGSPYIWYSLNSILLTLYFLNIYYCIVSLTAYLLVSSVISFIIFNYKQTNFVSYLFVNSSLILSFILITVAVQLLLILNKKLNRESKNIKVVNSELIEVNKRLEESMELTMSLYQAVHSFINLNNKDKLIDILIHYTRGITKTTLAFISISLEKQDIIIKDDKSIASSFKNTLKKEIKNKWDDLKNISTPVSICIEDRQFLLAAMKSSYKFYGILGIEINDSDLKLIYKQNLDQLIFLSSLSSIVLERFDLEGIKEQMLINEEQNRIANEIHDSVSQRLFAISCSIQLLTNKMSKEFTDDVKEELNMIKNSLNKAMKELREIIYGMSWKKGGISVFGENIRSYITEISKLYAVNISLNILGDEELVGSNVKRALYRIVCESTGNAIRHGKATRIDLSIDIDKNDVRVMIVDNGSGFDVKEKRNRKESGLGIKNIFNIAYSLNGRVDIESEVGEGTSINVLLPNNILMNSERGEAI